MNRGHPAIRDCECNGLWLLKNSLAEIALKNRRARMPYKRRSLIAYTFLVTNFGSVFRKTDFFNSHACLQHLRARRSQPARNLLLGAGFCSLWLTYIAVCPASLTSGRPTDDNLPCTSGEDSRPVPYRQCARGGEK